MTASAVLAASAGCGTTATPGGTTTGSNQVAITCGDPVISCNGWCVDATVDPENCGACDAACAGTPARPADGR